jgi:MarR family transcriptional regulator, organic hydroperoxide resistance regulator
LKVTPSAISLLVDRMESHGIVERVRSTLDRRVVQVRLTDVATQISAIMLRVARAQMEEFLEATPADEREPFLKNLTRFVKTIERVEDFIPDTPRLTPPEAT